MNERTYEPQIGALLRIAWEELQGEVFDGLRAAGFDDFRESMRPVMRYPPIDGLRPSELATEMGLSKQAANDMLRELESLGYIRLERDPSDGRARIIRYTERGWHLFDTGSSLSRQVGLRWAHSIGQAEYEALERALRAIAHPKRKAEPARRQHAR